MPVPSSISDPLRAAAALALIAGCALGLSACSSSSGGLFEGKNAHAIQASDFVSAEPASPVAENAQSSAPAEPKPLKRSPIAAPATPDTLTIGTNNALSSAAAPAAPPTLTNTVGAPPPVNPRAALSTEPVIVDSVVGQINGKPVIASEILEPLDGALRAAASKSRDTAGWNEESRKLISSQLSSRVRDELILSEARRTLTPEQRQGLLNFLETIQSNLVATQRGSSIAADETIREQTGRSLVEQAEDIRDQELIRNEVRQKIEPRVVVSWKDVQNEYERTFDKWNPPAEYTFRMIYTSTANSAAISAISSDLAAGKIFAEVAASTANDFNRREGGKIVRKHAGAQSQGEFSPFPDVNANLRTVGVSQVIGPFTYAPDKDKPDVTRTAWVYLEKIDQPESTSLYDAQLDIEYSLKSERQNTESQRYFERLTRRGNVSKLEVMRDRLMQIATDRYAPRFRSK